MRSDPKVRLQDTFPKQSICTILVNHSQSVLGKLNAGLGLHRLYDSPSWNGPKIKGVRQTGSIRPWQWKKEFDKLQILAVQVHKTHIKSGFCWAFKHYFQKTHFTRLSNPYWYTHPLSGCDRSLQARFNLQFAETKLKNQSAWIVEWSKAKKKTPNLVAIVRPNSLSQDLAGPSK